MKSRGFTVPLLALTLLSPWSSRPNAQSKPRVLLISATLVNFTLDDTSSLIAYSPAELWRPSTTACDNCLAPDAELAYAGTWHDGTHIIPTVDADDLPSDDHNDSKQGKPSSTSHAPTATQTTGQGDDDGDGEGDGDKGKNGGKGHNKRRIARSARQHKSLRRGGADDEDDPFFKEKEDSDDAGFVDDTISMSFNFTGSAVYVFALVPLFAAPANTTPTFVNLTYTLDSQPIGQFLHSGSPSVQPDSTSYLSSVPVFQKTGLAEGPHTLNVTVGPDSVFLLDYVVFSKSTQFGISGGSSNEPTSTNAAGSASGSQPTTSVGAASATGALNTATDTASPSSKSHNVATFAGAVGGSIGLLSLLALSLAFSLYRRRLKARRRDRTYRHSRGGEAPSVSSFHTDASEDGPPMQGPAPFVPRYFPGTVINTAPPPYSPAPPSSELTTALLTSEPEAPLPSISWSSRRSGGASGDSDSASYADRPPPTPPLNPLAGAAEVEDNYFAPPPSFQIAIASPIPAILAGLSGTTTSESSAPAVRPPTPSPPSPVIPLLAPPPSARPVSATITPVQTPDAGPSSSRTSLALAVPLEPTVSPRASSQSLRIQASEDNTSEPSDSELRPSRHSYPSLRSDSVATSSPVVTTSRPTTAREVGRILVSRDDGGGNISSR